MGGAEGFMAQKGVVIGLGEVVGSESEPEHGWHLYLKLLTSELKQGYPAG